MKAIDTNTRIAQRKAAWAGSWATLRDLEVLVAVIEEKKTTAAAAKLGISQPAVSRTLSMLEQKSGRKLFRHEGTAIVPTADALALYEEIQPVFEALTRLKDFQWERSSTSSLRVATTPTMAHCFLDEMTALFLKSHPDVRISMDIVTTPDALELVADQRADVAVADVLATSSGLLRSAFRRSRMVCAVPTDHPLAEKNVITVRDLDRQPMILLAKRNAMRPVIDRIFAKENSKPQVVIETSTVTSAMIYVAQGMGATLFNPFPAAIAAVPGVILREFSTDLPYESSFFTSGAIVASAVTQKYMEFVRHHQPPALFMSEPIS